MWAADKYHIAWDHDATRQLLEENCDVVKAYFAGHWHPGGYAYEGGIHHVTFQGIVEAWTTSVQIRMLLTPFATSGARRLMQRAVLNYRGLRLQRSQTCS